VGTDGHIVIWEADIPIGMDAAYAKAPGYRAFSFELRRQSRQQEPPRVDLSCFSVTKALGRTDLPQSDKSQMSTFER
jgi:hypothetical protein